MYYYGICNNLWSLRDQVLCFLLLLWNSSRAVREHSPQLGWALDGFPVYGPVGAKGKGSVNCIQFIRDVITCI